MRADIGRRAIRYIIVALFIILSVIFYVWQNIEVMKIHLDYRKGLGIEKRLVKDVDRLNYRIEQLRTIDSMNAYAGAHGLRPVGPGDIDVIEVKGHDGKK